MARFKNTLWGLHGVMPCRAWLDLAVAGACVNGVKKKDGVKPSRAYLSLVREQEQKRGGAVKE